jgi:hypothetical protein
MSDISPVAMSRLFTSLVGRDVRFAPLSAVPAESKSRQLYVTYSVLPDKEPLLVKTDLPLFGAMAGALVGLPYDSAIARAEETPMPELIRDAIHEVLNVASRGLSKDERVLLKGMAQDPVYLDGDVLRILKKPELTTYFKVTLANEIHGLFSILSRY